MIYNIVYTYAGVERKDCPGRLANGYGSLGLTRDTPITGQQDIIAITRLIEHTEGWPIGSVVITFWKRFEDVENCPTCNSMNVTVRPGYINRCYDCGSNWKV